MKNEEMTEKNMTLLEEIRELVIVGEQKLLEFSEESAKMEEKWLGKAEAKRAAAAKKQNV